METGPDLLRYVVGVAGFEPTTSSYRQSRSQSCRLLSISMVDLLERKIRVIASCHWSSMLWTGFRGVNGGPSPVPMRVPGTPPSAQQTCKIDGALPAGPING